MSILTQMAASGVAEIESPNPRPNLTYDLCGSNGRSYKPHPNGWAVSLEKMKELDRKGSATFSKEADGRIHLSDT